MGLLRSLSLMNLRRSWCVAIIFFCSPGLAQERSEPKPYAEFTLIAGGLLKPATGSTLGGGFGIGWGTRYTTGLEITHIQFGNYAIGVTDATRSVYPISNSRAWDITGNFQLSVPTKNPSAFKRLKLPQLKEPL